MENIGLILKERRQELGYSLEDMNIKTKLSVQQLKAIEDGDIQYFKEDLSYLSYFVRYYANSLDINYDEIRNELDDTILAFTDSVTLSQMQKQEDINSNIKKKTEAGAKPSKTGLTRAKKSRKLDLPSLGLLALALTIVAFLVYLSVQYLIPSFLNSTDPIQKPDITLPDPNTNTDGDDDAEKPTEPVAPVTPVVTYKITQTTPTDYEITGWTEGEDFTFDFIFNNRSWMEFSEDGVVLGSPASTIYEVSSNAKVILKATPDKELSIRYGALSGNVIQVNGTDVPFNEEIKNNSTATITFKFVKGATE